jgi:hypothetical protein
MCWFLAGEKKIAEAWSDGMIDGSVGGEFAQLAARNSTN